MKLFPTLFLLSSSLYGQAFNGVGLNSDFPEVSLPKTFLATCWDEDGISRSCSGTGEDGELQAGEDPPSPRFTDNGDGTVLDRYTNLLWLKNADCFGGQDWQASLDDANGLASGSCGLTDGSVAGDWSLPNSWELSSIQDHEQSGPGLPSGHPFTSVFNGTYWTSSTRPSLTDWAVTYSNNNPHIDFNDKDGGTGRTWPVRLSIITSRPIIRLPVTGLATCWDELGVSRSCTGTGEDGETQRGAVCPSPRFTNQGDGTILDNCTNLIWVRDMGCHDGNTWQEALTAVAGINSGECSLTDGTVEGDWRLANFYEGFSLLDFGESSPALPSGHPFLNVPTTGCHTNTTRKSVPGDSFAWNLNNGNHVNATKNLTTACSWAVRN